ncbi:MAG: LolA family protein [Myxococcota bacterium]
MGPLPLLAQVLGLVLAVAASAGGEPAQTPAAQAAPACLDRTVDALQARYEKVRDLRARFVQTTRPAHMAGTASEPVVSAGRMVVQKPARMRWTYEEPEPSLVVSDGESLWMYDPAFGEAQRLPVGEGLLSGAAVSFLLGEGDLRRDFAISLVSCEAERAELELVPREPASFERLRVVVNPETGDLSHTRIDDLLGNVTEVALSELETGVAPDPGTFRFVAPEGVEVVELEAIPTGSSGPSGP